MSFTLGDVVSGIPAKSGGRSNWGVTSDGSLGIIAAQQAITEITETAELEELKYTTPLPPATPLNLTVQNPIVPISAILGTIAANTAYPQFQTYASLITTINDIYTFWIWFQGGVNYSGRTLKYRRIPTVDMNTFGITTGTQQAYGIAPPVYYTRFNQYLQVGPTPDQNYFYFVRAKLPQPWPSASLAAQPIFAPDSWKDIFQYAAVMRLAADEGIQDSSIYKTASDFLEKRGMAPWQLRTLQMQRDERHNERSLSLRTGIYTWR